MQQQNTNRQSDVFFILTCNRFSVRTSSVRFSHSPIESVRWVILFWSSFKMDSCFREPEQRHVHTNIGCTHVETKHKHEALVRNKIHLFKMWSVKTVQEGPGFIFHCYENSSRGQCCYWLAISNIVLASVRGLTSTSSTHLNTFKQTKYTRLNNKNTTKVFLACYKLHWCGVVSEENLKHQPRKHVHVLVIFIPAPTGGLTYAVWNKLQKVLCEQQVSESQKAI